MADWIREHEGILWLAGIVSVVMILSSIILVPALVLRLRPDYFVHRERPPSVWADRHPLVRTPIIVGKNLLGGLLLASGVAMLLLPGQGLLTLVVGILLLDFPGKYRFEKWLIARPWVHKPVNWLRRRRGRPPFEVA